MSTPYTAALLAGGKFPGTTEAKATALWEGQALWQRQLELLQSLDPATILIHGDPDAPYAASGHRVISDDDLSQSPLAGLAALLNACTTDRLLLLAVELPWMTRAALQHLLSLGDGVVPEIEGVAEGTAAVYPIDILPLVRNTLQSPSRSCQTLVRLALNNGFIDLWQVEPEYRQPFQIWHPLASP